MKNKNESIFRKSSLERVSSPEQLNEYIRITNPSLILILMTILVMIVIGGFLVFSGGIPQYVNISGIAVTRNSDNQKIYSYVPISTARRLNEGMKVQISPEYAAREDYGYINGEVLKVGDGIITNEYLSEKFDNPSIISPVLSSNESNLIEVELSIDDWSSERGKNIDIIDGAICSVSAIIGEQKLAQLIFKG